MKRRDFLKSGLSLAALGCAGSTLPLRALATHGALTLPRTLVHTMLEGGADFRYIFVPTPAYDATYIDQFWSARSAIYTQNYPDYATMYAAEYTTVNDIGSGVSFGIHNDCGWLIQQFNAGNVAVVANSVGSLKRRHDQAQIVMYTGDLTASHLDVDRDGWGGRLVEATTGAASLVAVTENVSTFCKGTHSDDPLARVFHARNMRDIALPQLDDLAAVTADSNVMVRALEAYYKARGQEVQARKPGVWPYHRFFQHFNNLNNFGGVIRDRLEGHPLPSALSTMNLNDSAYALQCQNLYDSFLTADILEPRVISMEYLGWDHHASMQYGMSANLADVFGTGGGLDTVNTQLISDIAGIEDNLVYAFSSDFGRQLAANGGKGADHGRGSCSLIVGKSVRGGVYGDMFPLREAIPNPDDSAGRTPFEIPGQDIQGQTSHHRIMARVCDWVMPNSGNVVFPNAASSDLEAGVNLDNLISV